MRLHCQPKYSSWSFRIGPIIEDWEMMRWFGSNVIDIDGGTELYGQAYMRSGIVLPQFRCQCQPQIQSDISSIVQHCTCHGSIITINHKVLFSWSKSCIAAPLRDDDEMVYGSNVVCGAESFCGNFDFGQNQSPTTSQGRDVIQTVCRFATNTNGDEKQKWR